MSIADDFRRDGACVVRNLLDPAEVARLAEGVEENLAEPGERAVEGGGNAGTGRFFEDFRNRAGSSTTGRWRPHATSPSFLEVDGALGHGDPFAHPLFPVLWPRPGL